jgi:hypothetical protein
MEIFTNERKVKVNTEIGRWVSLAGLAVLIVGMVVSIRRPGLILISMGSLLVGFIASAVGAYYANHWTRTPRADQVLSGALKGISNKYHMYHYLLPVSHVMLGPTGLFVFRTYLHEGPVEYDGKKWRQKRTLARFFGLSGQDSLADPVRDAMHDAQRLQDWLAKRIAQDKVPDIQPFIVFVRDNVELDVAETSVPVVHHKQLKSRIRALDKACTEPLGQNQLYDIEQALVGAKIDEL